MKYSTASALVATIVLFVVGGCGETRYLWRQRVDYPKSSTLLPVATARRVCRMQVRKEDSVCGSGLINTLTSGIMDDGDYCWQKMETCMFEYGWTLTTRDEIEKKEEMQRSRDTAHYRYAVDALPQNGSISIRMWPSSDPMDAEFNAFLLKYRESHALFLEELLRTLPSSGLFDQVSVIAHDENARSDYVLAVDRVRFWGASLKEVAQGRPRWLSVSGTLLDVHQESEILNFSPMVRHHSLPGLGMSDQVDRDLAQRMSEDIVRSLRSRMAP